MAKKFDVNPDLLGYPYNAYMILYDEKSKGVLFRDGQGRMLSKEQMIEVAKGIHNFVNHYEKETIDEANEKNRRKNRIIFYNFSKRNKKDGYVFLYKELGTNFYRLGESKDAAKRIDALKSASPVELDFIHIIRTDDTSRLKQFLVEKYQGKLYSNNWYRLDAKDINYFVNEAFKDDYERWLSKIEDNRPVGKIVCANCGKTVTEKDLQGYYRCGICNGKYCSESCGYEHVCS